MVKLKEPTIGELCRTVTADGFSDYANPKRIRIAFYTLRMGMPEKDENEQVLQLARESEFVMNRPLFLRFAERVDNIKKWLDAHPIDELESDKDELKKFIHEKFTSNDIFAIWMGHEVKVPESMPVGLIPIMQEED